MIKPSRSRVAPPKSFADAYRFVLLRYNNGGTRVAKITGVRSVKRRNGTVECGFVILAWKAGAQKWDRTEGFIPDSSALDFATEADLIRVGLVVLAADGTWL